MKNKKYSIVIPTYNHLEDCLKPCVESILKYTDLSQIEIVVVANGCTDGTIDYLKSLDQNLVRWFEYPEALGYTKATNIGIMQSLGEYVVLFNNDALLLEQQQNTWLDMMYKPFSEMENVGITGPLKLHDIYVNHPVVIFFCAMIPRKLFFKFGLLDEIFSPGGGEDIDFTMKVLKGGYKCLQVPSDEKIPFTGTNSSIFPIWHQNNKTFGEIPEYGKSIIKKNGFINLKRHSVSIKLNIGSGYVGLQNYGFVSIDNKINDVDLFGNFLDFDFDNNSVDEIYAGHLINHMTREDAIKTIKKCYDIIKPGCLVAFEQPNFSFVCEEYPRSEPLTKIKLLNDLLEPLMWDGAVYTSQSFWDPDTLKEELERIGFITIMCKVEAIRRDGYNFRIEARKPL